MSGQMIDLFVNYWIWSRTGQCWRHSELAQTMVRSGHTGNDLFRVRNKVLAVSSGRRNTSIVI
jgi:hypothetical protein